MIPVISIIDYQLYLTIRRQAMRDQIRLTVMTSTVVLLPFIGLLKADGCLRTHIQRCDNCKAHSTCWPPISVLIDVGAGDCRQACRNQEDCLMAEYTTNNVSYLTSISPEPLSVCRLYNCTDVTLDGGVSVFRKSCTSDCLYYELEEVSSQMVRCASASLFGKKDLRDKWQCLSMCLDYTGCMGAAFYKPNYECSLHDCHEMISFNSFWISYKRICKDGPSETSAAPTKTETMKQSTPRTLLSTTIKHISSKVMATEAISRSLLFTLKSSTTVPSNGSVLSNISTSKMSLSTVRSGVPNKKCSMNNKASVPALCIVTILIYLLTF